jgi:hypothetical protein
MKKGYHKQPPALFTLDRSPQPQIPEAMEDIHRKQEVCYEILTHVPRHFGITINLAHHRTITSSKFPAKKIRDCHHISHDSEPASERQPT